MDKEFDFNSVGKSIPYTVDDRFFESVSEKILVKSRQRRNTLIIKRFVGIAASIVIVCCVSLFYVNNRYTTVDELISKMSDTEIEYLVAISDSDVLLNEEF